MNKSKNQVKKSKANYIAINYFINYFVFFR